MRKSLLILPLLLAACGYPTATHCDGTGFGKGVDSVLPIDCGVFYQNFEHAVDIISQLALHVDIPTYRHRMSHVHVEVRSINSWFHGDERVDGDESVDVWSGHVNIKIDEYGTALLHETLHAYADVSYFDNVGSILAFPVEETQNDSHVGWIQHCVQTDQPGDVDPNDQACGYYDADHAYTNDCMTQSLGNGVTGCQTLQPIPTGANIYR